MEGSRIQKLAKRYYGHFTVTRQIGEVAFELALPPESKIHPIFHVSKLKPCHGDVTEPSLSLPEEAHNNQPKIHPLAILDWRKVEGSGNTQTLIQWQRLYPEDSTWESIQELLAEFPSLHLEDKVIVEGERDVMNLNENGEPVNSEDCEIDNPITHVKPKRNRARPKYLEDYATD